ncbi:helix-turn-helix transcriptional regulator [Umezawaea sp.]|uniref:helix-turn-helix domain-containing protein n=1 Tax=Umezawaea sp. TaxID=1955258 RepID=UPI002ED5A039
MAVKKHTPTVRLRRLAGELRRLRAASGLSREDVAEATGINDSTLYRIETARTRPQKRTLLTLLKHYDTDEPQREHLVALSKESTEQGWLRGFHSDLPEEYTAYISFEAEALGVSNYESLFIPGLLQTEDYARAVIRGVLPMANTQEVEDRVQARMERRGVLSKEQPLKLWAIVDEAALHRLVGGGQVMHAQLRHLLDVTREPHITLQVIPYSTGAHAGMPGSFVLMDFADPMDTDLIYIDSMAGDLFLESEADISRYSTIFDNLRAVALSPDSSVELVAHIAREIE